MKIVNTLSIAILAMLSFGVHADMKQKILEQKRFVLYDSRRLTGECLPICVAGPPTPFPTSGPTMSPTAGPTDTPTRAPTAAPTPGPTAAPTPGPTAAPTRTPTATPTSAPTPGPTAAPTPGPTAAPTPGPTAQPTAAPTPGPTAAPTPGPTVAPTRAPTAQPTAAPTPGPTASPTRAPTAQPTAAPTKAPTAAPTKAPTAQPTAAPTKAPTAQPTAAPTNAPTAAPTVAPYPRCYDNFLSNGDSTCDVCVDQTTQQPADIFTFKCGNFEYICGWKKMGFNIPSTWVVGNGVTTFPYLGVQIPVGLIPDGICTNNAGTMSYFVIADDIPALPENTIPPGATTFCEQAKWLQLGEPYNGAFKCPCFKPRSGNQPGCLGNTVSHWACYPSLDWSQTSQYKQNTGNGSLDTCSSATSTCGSKVIDGTWCGTATGQAFPTS